MLDKKTYLRPKVVFWLKAENLHGCYIQVYEDVFEGGSVPWLWGPALFDQQFVPLRAGPWDGELKRIRTDPEYDCRAINILKEFTKLKVKDNRYHGRIINIFNSRIFKDLAT